MDARIMQPVSRRLRDLADKLLALQQAESMTDMAACSLALIDEAFPDSFITFNIITPATRQIQVKINRMVPGLDKVAAEIGRCVVRDNPLLAHQARQGHPAPLVARITDFMTQREFARTELYALGFKPFGCKTQLGDIILAGRRYVGLGIQRDRDFCDDELALQKVLHAHLLRALSERWDERDSLRSTLPTPAFLEKLTPREREVLHWIREGKRNAEIATILECRPGTVKVHCENIYRKLGVETRTAAANLGRR